MRRNNPRSRGGMAFTALLVLTGCGTSFQSAQTSGVSSTSVGSPSAGSPSNDASSGTTVAPVTPSVPSPAPVAFTGMNLKQSNYTAYGDSITGGFGASGAAAFYVNLLAADAGATLSNYARAGQLTCNIAMMEVFAQRVPQTSDGAAYVTLMEGTNDANTQDVGAYETNFNSCQQASLAWLSVPYTAKAYPRGGQGCTTSGDWDINYYQADSMTAHAPGDRMDCALSTTGGPLYLWYEVADGNGGAFTYSIDGGPAVAVNAASAVSLVNSNNTERTGVFMVRVPGVGAGAHHVAIVVTSPKADVNSVTLWGIGTPPPNGQVSSAPRVFVTGVAYQNGDARRVQTATYDADAARNVGAAQADGLPVSFVDVRKYLKGTAAEMADQLHPNDLGHREVRDAFKAVITGQ